ncbi:ubiquitin carboxyl-terminal hydrolase 28 isoform X2 [Ambystoma mexicanum]|uniref:ubiquitin carboxyl-terminal hydrolase 28 isoform X2 n=1 Tax=Ambystoma mexicanum TaxID=8296 RepID=UPI0037E9B3D2
MTKQLKHSAPKPTKWAPAFSMARLRLIRTLGGIIKSLNAQMLLNQLREITGIHDSSFLHEALKASNGDLTQAVSLLTEEGAKEPGVDTEATEPSDIEGSAVGKQGRSSVIDLTNDKEALQAAIALSLRDSANQQADGRDHCRSNETELSESRNRSKRKRCEVWRDHPNPNEWRRVDNWPVGMKNIGNTCWFSAVIQSLFQLPEFRRLVLGYNLPQSILENCQNHNEKRNIAFMQELQYLFALMVGSNCKFVDPSAALELLKDAFLSVEAQQQDVSEFTHKLLDWLEDAFQLAVNVDTPRDKSENPMVQLFYGTFLTEGIHEGKTFSNIETFGQYPLQVNGYRNLGQCLEGAMLEGETEASTSDHPVKYVQERWFTKLPPVLTFELSRFEFNQSLGQPEKIHNKLEFPQVIYMDRYLYRNKELIRTKREEIRRLKGKVKFLQQKLERYLKYGSGPSRYPLPDVLQYALEFARTPPMVCCTNDSELASSLSRGEPLPSVASSEIDCPSEEEKHNTKEPDFPPATSLPPHHLTHRPHGLCRTAAQMSEYPSPRIIIEEELQNVETCLQRWRTEVEQDIQDLKNCIDETTQAIEQMYTDPALAQVPYRLHAVLVHEGQANAGHYWAYIYSHISRSWLKYNDISVTESSWEELERDSFGGLKNASAYCLIYISDQLPHFNAEDTDAETGLACSTICSLSPGLKRYVREDNRRFELEVEEWEEELKHKIPQIVPAADSESEEFSSAPSEEPPCTTSNQERSLSSDNAIFTKEQTAQAIANTAESFEKHGVEAALTEPNEADAEGGSTECKHATQAQSENKQEPSSPRAEALSSSHVSEVDIPSVGRILVRSDADGYNEEAFREEYSRLHLLSEEVPTPHNDPRLQHVLVYFFQNSAPKRVIERTLLEQFADRNLSYDERSISIMKVARAKLREIGPEDMDMEEYKTWHEDYSLFRKVSVYLLTGLELYQNGKCQEALTYLVYAYQSNTTLLQQGQSRGVEQSLVALYRRKCLLELNDAAASMFESGQEDSVSEAATIMNELIIPSMQLIVNCSLSQEDLDAIEVMRNRWCSYLGQDIDESSQMKLGEFLPRLLDCSAEIIVLKEPPKIRPNSPYDLCSRFAAVMESIHSNSAVTVT